MRKIRKAIITAVVIQLFGLATIVYSQDTKTKKISELVPSNTVGQEYKAHNMRKVIDKGIEIATEGYTNPQGKQVFNEDAWIIYRNTEEKSGVTVMDEGTKITDSRVEIPPLSQRMLNKLKGKNVWEMHLHVNPNNVLPASLLIPSSMDIATWEMTKNEFESEGIKYEGEIILGKGGFWLFKSNPYKKLTTELINQYEKQTAFITDDASTFQRNLGMRERIKASVTSRVESVAESLGMDIKYYFKDEKTNSFFRYESDPIFCDGNPGNCVGVQSQV